MDAVSLPAGELEFVEAEDFEALQILFSKHCDKEGLITKNAVMEIPAIAELIVRFLFCQYPTRMIP